MSQQRAGDGHACESLHLAGSVLSEIRQVDRKRPIRVSSEEQTKPQNGGMGGSGREWE